MELWELAAATGNYLGPTPEEEKLDAMYAQREKIEARMKENALRKRGGEYPTTDVRVHGAS